MNPEINAFYRFLAQPLFFRWRFALALCVVPLALSFTQPLWRITIQSPRIDRDLSLSVYAHTIESGSDGRDLRDINVLNHYVGMKPISRQDLTDLDWIPFGLCLLVILTLRCAAIGDVSSLLDLVVLTGYAGLFGLARFAYRLHSYGHNLNPDAPTPVEPFTPAILGTQQVGDLTVTSQPAAGVLLVGVFVAALVAILAYHLVVGRREAVARAGVS